jgi:hypothetical protein
VNLAHASSPNQAAASHCVPSSSSSSSLLLLLLTAGATSHRSPLSAFRPSTKLHPASPVSHPAAAQAKTIQLKVRSLFTIRTSLRRHLPMPGPDLDSTDSIPILIAQLSRQLALIRSGLNSVLVLAASGATTLP